MMVYPGGKNGMGIYQRIINLMPPHDVYIEPFLGSGAVLRHKKPARVNLGIDVDQAAIELCRSLIVENGDDRSTNSYFDFQCADVFDRMLHWPTSPTTVIFYDPPYPHETRTKKKIYANELCDADHTLLLSNMLESQSMQMITGYRCDLYNNALADWHSIDYPAQTRGGTRTETLWFNFDEPTELHDYSFLGDNFRERDRIRKKQKRWQKRWAKMDRLERQAILAVMNDEKQLASPELGLVDSTIAGNGELISPEDSLEELLDPNNFPGW